MQSTSSGGSARGQLPGVTFDKLKDVVEARVPRTTEDLLVIVRYALARLQMELRGSDTDAIDKYWRDDGQPRDEDSSPIG